MSEFPSFTPYVLAGYGSVSDQQFDGTPEQQALQFIAYDDLKSAHDLVEEKSGDLAAYIHGVIHRREGDFFNANYWFQRAEPLPGLLGIRPDELTKLAQENAQDNLGAFRDEWNKLVELAKSY
ncbi:MAG TPA: hypothetical protein VK171_14140 [Fimbriimonas sp.]|nr:hypothetical protein [Fimbriimonas sp.]